MMIIKKQKGFTLIELMITVAILGILAAIAVPSYSNYVRKGKRAEARAALEELSQAMEKHRSVNFSYLGAGAGAGGNTGAPKATLLSYNKLPKTGTGATTYNLTIQAATAKTYTVRATPVGDQAFDVCGYLEANQNGVKTTEKSAEEC